MRELGQPSLTIEPDRAKIARYGLNVADINALIETAVGGAPATQVIQGERSVRSGRAAAGAVPAEHGRDQEPADRHAGRPAPAAQPVRRHQGRARARRSSTARANSRFIGIQFSVEGRDLASAVGEAQQEGRRRRCTLPIGYTFDWGGEYKEYLAARSQMTIILPLTVVLILLILFALYGNLKFPLIIMFSVLVTVPVGGLLALKLTGTQFQRVVRASASSR